MDDKNPESLAMPEYQRTKNRVLDLLDQSQHSVLELLRIESEVKNGRQSVYYDGDFRKADNAITDSYKDATLKLLNFYLYMRPKMLKKKSLDDEYHELQEFEETITGLKDFSKISQNSKTLLLAFNALREYCEKSKLTHFEVDHNPYLELLRSHKGE